MKLHYAGKYNLQEKSLPTRNDIKNAIPFDEPSDLNELAIIASKISIVVLIISMAIGLITRWQQLSFDNKIILGMIFPLFTAIPHEFLHALCFKEDVYLYTNLKQGMLFVTGTETMSKNRFIFMSLFPNLSFGFIPYLVFLCCIHEFSLLLYASLTLTMGAGDYLNVYHAMTQMPRGSRAFLSGIKTYWYQD